MNPVIKIIPVFLLLFSCNRRQPTNSPEAINTATPDTSKPVITTSAVVNSSPVIFETAFGSDTKVVHDSFTYSFYTLDIGKIKVVSGKLIACDPIVMHDRSPFTQKFPVGEFPVQLAMAKTYNDERVAFSRILFSDAPVARWEFALLEGQRQLPLNDSNFYCYGVDAGTGIFIDSVSNNIFSKKDYSVWTEVFVNKAEQNGYKGYLYDFEGHNLATFSTGYGDGCYATFVGLDKTGKICRLLTDFAIVEWWKLDEPK